MSKNPRNPKFPPQLLSKITTVGGNEATKYCNLITFLSKGVTKQIIVQIVVIKIQLLDYRNPNYFLTHIVVQLDHMELIKQIN